MDCKSVKIISEGLFESTHWAVSHLQSEEKLMLDILPHNQDIRAISKISLAQKRRESLSARYLLRWICTEMGIDFKGIHKNKSGVPFLVGSSWHISYSHTAEYCAVALSAHKAVGIDIEKPRPQVLKIAPRVFSQKELNLAHSIEDLSLFWSAKEAVYKCAGIRGLSLREEIRLEQKPQKLSSASYMYQGKKTVLHLHHEKVGSHGLVIAT
ncbi:MAG: 4'-phosphopantetheinyl transferase superfamily protein [Bernardetiaceae bacterium]|nr:4'-phosphopantetheinyl transferase superfamily protein [Bernardetiaceae bacterium]